MGAAAAQGAQRGIALGQSVGLCKRRGMKLRWSAACGSAGAQRGAQLVRCVGLLWAWRGTAQGAAWDCSGA